MNAVDLDSYLVQIRQTDTFKSYTAKMSLIPPGILTDEEKSCKSAYYDAVSERRVRDLPSAPATEKEPFAKRPKLIGKDNAWKRDNGSEDLGSKRAWTFADSLAIPRL